MASNDQESAEDLLAHRADPNIASEGEEPPLCVAVRHRRAVWRTDRGLTPLELAAGDERMLGLLTDFCDTQDDVRASAFDI